MSHHLLPPKVGDLYFDDPSQEVRCGTFHSGHRVSTQNVFELGTFWVLNVQIRDAHLIPPPNLAELAAVAAAAILPHGGRLCSTDKGMQDHWGRMSYLIRTLVLSCPHSVGRASWATTRPSIPNDIRGAHVGLSYAQLWKNHEVPAPQPCMLEALSPAGPHPVPGLLFPYTASLACLAL